MQNIAKRSNYVDARSTSIYSNSKRERDRQSQPKQHNDIACCESENINRVALYNKAAE